MKRIVRLTESDLSRITKKIVKEYRPYGKSLQDLEDSFWNKDEFVGDMQWMLNNKVYEPNKQKHYEKLNNLKTYYADKMVYDFLQNPNFTSEENTKLEELDEKLSNPNLGSDKIERFKNLKREIYVNAFDRYLDTLDKRHLDQYFIGQKYPYFKDKIKDFVYNGNVPSEPSTPNPNFVQRTANKVKGYLGLSENKKLTETDLSRIVKRVIKETFDLDSEKYGGKYHYQGKHGMDTIGPPQLHPNFEKSEWMREKLYELIDSGEYQEAAKLYKKIPVGGILPNEVRDYLESLGPHAFSSFEREL